MIDMNSEEINKFAKEMTEAIFNNLENNKMEEGIIDNIVKREVDKAIEKYKTEEKMKNLEKENKELKEKIKEKDEELKRLKSKVAKYSHDELLRNLPRPEIRKEIDFGSGVKKY